MPQNLAERFVEAARSYLDVPWRHMGRDRHGVDCIGMVMCAARDVGMVPPEPPPYARGYRGPELMRALQLIGSRVPLDERRVGDILAFRDASRFTAHVGILSLRYDSEYVINARADYRKVIEEPLSDLIWEKLLGVFRPAGFED